MKKVFSIAGIFMVMLLWVVACTFFSSFAELKKGESICITRSS